MPQIQSVTSSYNANMTKVLKVSTSVPGFQTFTQCRTRVLANYAFVVFKSADRPEETVPLMQHKDPGVRLSLVTLLQSMPAN